MRRAALALFGLVSLSPPAGAVVGGATALRGDGIGRHIVMIVGARGNLCTGTALAQDLVLTAAHCVAPPSTYGVLLPGPVTFTIRQIAVHPRYSRQHYVSGTVTADVALLKLTKPLPESVTPAALAADAPVAPGDRFTIAGYGTTAAHSEAGIGAPRSAELVATGKPGALQIRLLDPATRDKAGGLGACTGDSGGPAFRDQNGTPAIVGVVSWSTGPQSSDGCGGLTGLTPIQLYRGWLVETARKLGNTVGP